MNWCRPAIKQISIGIKFSLMDSYLNLTNDIIKVDFNNIMH